MKKIVFLLLALTLLAGCNKETESTSDLAPVGGVISLRTQSELKDNSMTGVTQKLSVTSGITSEFPTPTSTSNVSLNLKLDPSMQFDTQTSSTTCDVRFIIEISGQDENGDRGRLLEKKVQSYKPASNGQYPINLELADGKYYITVWMDYVDENSVGDKYYETNSLSSISVNTPYVGNDDFKEVYVAQQVIEVSGAATLDMTLKQPMGKFEFITTDIEKFLGEQADDFDLSTLKVHVAYSDFLPTEFNAYTNKPSDASAGISFNCSMTRLANGKARLASDYVFVTGSESSVQVVLSIYNNEGELLNSKHFDAVPIQQGQLTTISGAFLTHNSDFGIAINPNLDGEFNIQIPDDELLVYTFEAWTCDANPRRVMHKTTTGTLSAAAIEITLVPGDYYFLFWADYGKGEYTTEDLRQVLDNRHNSNIGQGNSSMPVFESVRDAFAAVERVTWKGGESAVTLRRPMAKLNIKNTEPFTTADKAVSVTYRNVPTRYDVLTGLTSEPVQEITYSFPATAAGSAMVGEDFLFVPTQDATPVGLVITVGGVTRELGVLPLQSNYRTVVTARFED